MEILTLTLREVTEIHEYQRPKKILHVFNEKPTQEKEFDIGLQKKTPYTRRNELLFKNSALQFYKPNYYSDMKTK